MHKTREIQLLLSRHKLFSVKQRKVYFLVLSTEPLLTVMTRDAEYHLA